NQVSAVILSVAKDPEAPNDPPLTGAFRPGINASRPVAFSRSRPPHSFQNFFSAFSAQKSHVKPQKHLTPSNKRKSGWHVSYPQPVILDIGSKKEDCISLSAIIIRSNSLIGGNVDETHLL